MRVVPALDVAEERQAGLGLGLEGVPVEQLALEAGEEALAQGVVVGVADILPIDGRTPASRQRRPKASEVY